jgi:hypothetical protein
MEKGAGIYKQVRYGISVQFDIYDYLYDIIAIKGKTGKALYRGKAIKLREIWTELEKRNNLMKVWLVENMKEEPLIGLRV